MEVLIEENGFIRYFIKSDSDKEYSFVFEVWQVNVWSENKEPLEDDMELFLSGTIKWDGCSHVYFGEEDGYLHLCGHRYFEDVKSILDAVWSIAEKEIVKFNKEVAY